MSLRKFLTVRRRVAGCCWTLFALSILTAPGLAWAQVCNDFSDVSKSPDLTYTLGDTVNVTYTFGAETLSEGLQLTTLPEGASQVRVALDCETAFSGGNREDCLGLPLGTTPSLDDGDAILYAGNPSASSTVGDACDGVTFSVVGHGDGSPPEADPNVVIFQADGTVVFDQGERCAISFDVVVNNIGMMANWEPADGGNPDGNQTVNAAAGFDGFCTSTLGASSTKSFAYTIAIVPNITLIKEVSIDGGTTWYDANDEDTPYPIGIVPDTTAQYRLIAENVGEEPLANVVFNDATLGLVDVALPDRCYDSDNLFQPFDPCTITSGDFPLLGDPPVQICQTAGVKRNEACVDAAGGATQIPVQACDEANVECLEPSISVTKTGPPKAKVGDEVTYTICAENTGSVNLENCTLDDTLLGDQGLFRADAMPLLPGVEVCDDYPRTVLSGDPDQLENIATVTCDVAGSAGSVSGSDNHIVDLFQPLIEAFKTGDPEGKVGDEYCYTIGYNDLSSDDTPPLVNCTGTDTVLGPLDGTFEDGVGRQFCQTLPATPNPLVNVVTITCELDGYDNGLPAPAEATHSVTPLEVAPALTKTCSPKDPVPTVPEPISWEICVDNSASDIAVDCTINDETAGITDANVVVAAGVVDCTTTASRPTTSADAIAGSVSNTASAVCSVVGYDNEPKTLTATDTCAVREVREELCRTPGFWKTHAGVEKANRSNNLTQAVIDYSDDLFGSGDGTFGLGDICGVRITDTTTYNYAGTGIGDSNGYESAVEGMCVHPKQKIIRQLMRQLIAASLNCVASGGGADCTGVSVAADWASANAACVAEAADMSDWIEKIDAFNNGEPPYNCTENIGDSVVFDDWDGPKVPGPAGSSNACNAATYNDFYLVPLPTGVQ